MVVLFLIAGLFLLLEFMAIVKKPSSVYLNQPEQQNPMQGKIVVYVENPSEPLNADGVCGHLDAIEENTYKTGSFGS